MVKKIVFKVIWNRNALDNFKEILGFLSDQGTKRFKKCKRQTITAAFSSSIYISLLQYPFPSLAFLHSIPHPAS